MQYIYTRRLESACADRSCSNIIYMIYIVHVYSLKTIMQSEAENQCDTLHVHE